MSDPGGGGVPAGARSVDEEAWVEDDRDAMVIEDPIQPQQMQEPTYLGKPGFIFYHRFPQKLKLNAKKTQNSR